MDISRFESHLERVPFSGCWLWCAATSTNGYGRTWGNRKSMAAHRMSWMLYRGEIPNGMHVLHKCDVKLCVNPEHLYIGDQSNNMIDRHVRSRDNNANKKKTHCNRGHEYTEENTIKCSANARDGGIRHYRVCRECHRLRWHLNKKAK